MDEGDRRGREDRSRPDVTRGGSTRPREAPRPDRPNRSDGASVTLSAPSFVPLSADDERRAIESLAELLVPLLVQSVPPDVEPAAAPTDGPAVTARGDA